MFNVDMFNVDMCPVSLSFHCSRSQFTIYVYRFYNNLFDNLFYGFLLKNHKYNKKEMSTLSKINKKMPTSKAPLELRILWALPTDSDEK